jgi:predicted Kef-type K+ transport protein
MEVYFLPIILVLLSIIGFFIVREFKFQDRTNVKLIDSIDRLNETMGDIKGEMKLNAEKIKNIDEKCQLRHRGKLNLKTQ